MLFPTLLPHCPFGALRGHTAHGNSSLFSQASGHLTVRQPAWSSATSAMQLVIDFVGFFSLAFFFLLISPFFLSEPVSMFSRASDHSKGLITLHN